MKVKVSEASGPVLDWMVANPGKTGGTEMKWYVSDFKEQKSGARLLMAIAGPFDTREQADAWHTKHVSEIRCGVLSQGIDDLGPDWKKNIELWKAGELK